MKCSIIFLVILVGLKSDSIEKSEIYRKSSISIVLNGPKMIDSCLCVIFDLKHIKCFMVRFEFGNYSRISTLYELDIVRSIVSDLNFVLRLFLLSWVWIIEFKIGIINWVLTIMVGSYYHGRLLLIKLKLFWAETPLKTKMNFQQWP